MGRLANKVLLGPTSAQRMGKVMAQTLQEKKKSFHPAIAPMKEALITLKAALLALEEAKPIFQSIAETGIAASVEADLALRALFAEDYDDERLKLPGFIEKKHKKSLPLLGKDAKPLVVPLTTGGQYCITCLIFTPEQNGFDLPPPKTAFSTQKEVALILNHLDHAFKKLERNIVRYEQDKTFLSLRLKLATGIEG